MFRNENNRSFLTVFLVVISLHFLVFLTLEFSAGLSTMQFFFWGVGGSRELLVNGNWFFEFFNASKKSYLWEGNPLCISLSLLYQPVLPADACWSGSVSSLSDTAWCWTQYLYGSAFWICSREINDLLNALSTLPLVLSLPTVPQVRIHTYIYNLCTGTDKGVISCWQLAEIIMFYLITFNFYSRLSTLQNVWSPQCTCP